MKPNLLIRPGKPFLCFTIRLPKKEFDVADSADGPACAVVRKVIQMLLRLRLLRPRQWRPSVLALFPAWRRIFRRCSQWKQQTKDRTLRGCFLYDHVPAVVLHNLLHDCEPQPGSIFLAMADEGFKQLPANRFRNASPVVAYPNLNSALYFIERDLDSACLRHNRFARIQQKVIQGPLQLLRIKPSRAVAALTHRDPHLVEFRVYTYGLHNPLDRVPYVAVRRPQRFAGTRELQQRIDEIGHLVHRHADFLIELFPLVGRQPAFAQKFRIRHNGGEGMA